MAVRVRLAPQGHLATDDGRALGDGHHGVAAGVRPLVGHEQLGQPVDLERDLGDDRPVHARQVGGHQGRLTAVPAEDLDHRQTLV
jgi:hypothetical protein